MNIKKIAAASLIGVGLSFAAPTSPAVAASDACINLPGYQLYPPNDYIYAQGYGICTYDTIDNPYPNYTSPVPPFVPGPETVPFEPYNPPAPAPVAPEPAPAPIETQVESIPAPTNQPAPVVEAPASQTTTRVTPQAPVANAPVSQVPNTNVPAAQGSNNSVSEALRIIRSVFGM